MNREILFKAKRKDNGEWVEGYYVYCRKRTICPLGDSVKPEDEQHVIMRDGFSDWNMPRNTVVYEINPDTICQYTGLTDKNGSSAAVVVAIMIAYNIGKLKGFKEVTEMDNKYREEFEQIIVDFITEKYERKRTNEENKTDTENP